MVMVKRMFLGDVSVASICFETDGSSLRRYLSNHMMLRREGTVHSVAMMRVAYNIEIVLFVSKSMNTFRGNILYKHLGRVDGSII